MISSPNTPAGPIEFRRISRGERGYAMLMVMFMATAMLIAASAVAINNLTEARRQREEELAWRGHQYVRGIKLYYQKNGRFPKDLDDLTKYVIDQPRFMRKIYKDPMNTVDGSWRFIYLGPGGTLINGVIHKTWAGGVLGGPQPGQAPGTGTPGSAPVGGPAQGGMTTSGSSGSATPTTGQPGSNQAGQSPGGSGSGPIGSGTTFGGQLVGIASTVKQPSIRVFDGGITYFEWEFICDPTRPGNVCNTTGIGTLPGAPTAPPAGTGTGTPPPQNPPAAPAGPGGPGTNPQQSPQ